MQNGNSDMGPTRATQSPNPSQFKERLDRIFGCDYKLFSDLIVQPGVQSSFGVVPAPLSPLIEVAPPRVNPLFTAVEYSPTTSATDDSSSTAAPSLRVPDADVVLQNMQSMVKEGRLSNLDCSANGNCLPLPAVKNGEIPATSPPNPKIRVKLPHRSPSPNETDHKSKRRKLDFGQAVVNEADNLQTSSSTLETSTYHPMVKEEVMDKDKWRILDSYTEDTTFFVTNGTLESVGIVKREDASDMDDEPACSTSNGPNFEAMLEHIAHISPLLSPVKPIKAKFAPKPPNGVIHSPMKVTCTYDEVVPCKFESTSPTSFALAPATTAIFNSYASPKVLNDVKEEVPEVEPDVGEAMMKARNEVQEEQLRVPSPKPPPEEDGSQCSLRFTGLPKDRRVALMKKWASFNRILEPKDEIVPNVPSLAPVLPNSPPKIRMLVEPAEVAVAAKLDTVLPPTVTIVETPTKKLTKVISAPKEELREKVPVPNNPTKSAVVGSGKKMPYEHFLLKSKPLAKATTELTGFEKPSYDSYYNQGRTLKYRAVEEKDRIRQTLFYFESLVYYIMSATFKSDEYAYQLIMDSVTFLNETMVTLRQNKAEIINGQLAYFRLRIKTIERLVNACLTFRLYSIKSTQAFNNYTILSQFEKDFKFDKDSHSMQQRKRGNGADSVNSSNGGTCSNTTPSPSASTPSSNRSASANAKETVSVPVEIYRLQQQQIKTLNQLMWAHRMWNEASSLRELPENREFFRGLTGLCGMLERESELRVLAEYLLTAVRWMQRDLELQLEKLRKTGSGSSSTKRPYT